MAYLYPRHKIVWMYNVNKIGSLDLLFPLNFHLGRMVFGLKNHHTLSHFLNLMTAQLKNRVGLC